ncbi:hypothetical protein N665_0479s0021 [Sinapis alba]|nr:hypothetical protein N665_0479s0021 [Sinapis alba]
MQQPKPQPPRSSELFRKTLHFSHCLVRENRTTLRHRSAIDGEEAREGGMESYPARSIKLDSQVKKNFMIKPHVLAYKPKHWLGLV